MKDTSVVSLNEAGYAVWSAVNERGPIQLEDAVTLTGLDQAQVSAIATLAAEQGFFRIRVSDREELVPSGSATETVESRMPEYAAAKKLFENGTHLPITEFVKWAKTANLPVNEIFRWGEERGWIERVKGPPDAKGKEAVVAVALTNMGRESFQRPDDDVRALQLARAGTLYLDSLAEQGIDAERVRRLIGNRPEIAKIKKRAIRELSITEGGKHALKTGCVRVMKERNTLTSEDLESGAWREINLRPYDVTLSAREIYPAKIHPLRKILEQTRRAFLEMGFTEVISPMVESAFWNFDALFQPQDHPARDMQDTFYMRHPSEAPLPSDSIVEPVRQTHENGWNTGSEGWGYKWSPERSRQVVLRTHTTAATIRALAANPNPPGKFFCVGWAYRNETTSFKHLPVFHQVDGIIVDEEANLASLMGTLQEFYSKMGFGRVKFKPAFYPYTEPSVDVVVYMESRREWIEMGGAGIFRPEVTLPLGCSHPVLAWGLGIERLAMLRFGGVDLRLMSTEYLPEQGRNIVYVATDASGKLHFRIFDGSAQRIADKSETDISGKADQLQALKKLLADLRGTDDLTSIQKRNVLDKVTSILGLTRFRLDDIRELYSPSLDALEGVPLCR